MQLNPDDLALWEIPLPAGTPVTIDLTARTAHGYSVSLINLSLTDHVYYNVGDTTETRGRQAQAILPGNTNLETLGINGTRYTFICATDTKLDIVRS